MFVLCLESLPSRIFLETYFSTSSWKPTQLNNKSFTILLVQSRYNILLYKVAFTSR